MRSSLDIQRSVIFAFFLRELKTRFGNYRLSYLWAVLEPLLHLCVILAVFGALGRKFMPGVDFVAFVVTGLEPFFLFRQICNRTADAVSANRPLLVYRTVQPLDDIWARILLELVIFFAVICLLLGGYSLFGHPVWPVRPLEVFLAWFLLAVFAGGVGITFGVVYAFFSDASKILPMLNRPLYFVSGVFFPLAVIPLSHRHWFLWNPILHAIELGRENFFVDYPSAGASWLYLTVCAVSSLTLGLGLYRLKRFQLLASA